MSILQSIKQQMFRLCFYNIWYHNLFSFAGLINLIILPAGIYYYALPLIAPETLSLMMLCGIIKITIAVTPPFIIEALRALHNKISQFTRQCAKALWPFKQHMLVDPKNDATRPVPANDTNNTIDKVTKHQLSPTKDIPSLTTDISLTEASKLITVNNNFVEKAQTYLTAKKHRESSLIPNIFSSEKFTFTFPDDYYDFAKSLITKSITSIQQPARQDIDTQKETRIATIVGFFPEFEVINGKFMGQLHASYTQQNAGKPYDQAIQTRFDDNRVMINARLLAYLYVLLDIPSTKNLNTLIKISQDLLITGPSEITGPREITSFDKDDNTYRINSKLPLIRTLIMELIQQQSEPKKNVTETIERLLTAIENRLKKIEEKRNGKGNESVQSATKAR